MHSSDKMCSSTHNYGYMVDRSVVRTAYYNGGEGERKGKNSLDIDIGSGFIQNKDLVFPEESSGQADQLPLAYTEVGPTLSHHSLQPSLQLLHSTLQLYLQLPEEGVGILSVT